MTQNEFSQVKNIIKGLRADVLYTCELVLSDRPEQFLMVRKKMLDLFGKTRGAEAQLQEICNASSSDNGQARFRESCGKGAR